MHTIANSILLVVAGVVGLAAIVACLRAASKEDRRWAERQKEHEPEAHLETEQKIEAP